MEGGRIVFSQAFNYLNLILFDLFLDIHIEYFHKFAF